jgi:hypothetical protein
MKKWILIGAMTIIGISVALIPASGIAQEDGWATYENSTYNLSIDYPQNWLVEERIGDGWAKVIFSGPREEIVRLCVIEPVPMFRSSFAITSFNTDFEFPRFVTKGTVTESAINLKIERLKGREVIGRRDNIVYKLVCLANSSDFEEVNEKCFQRMISSFLLQQPQGAKQAEEL